MIELALPTCAIQWPSSDIDLLSGCQIVGGEEEVEGFPQPDGGGAAGFPQPDAARPTVLHEVQHDQFDGASGVLDGDDPWLDADWARAEHSSTGLPVNDGQPDSHGSAVARPDHEPAGADTSSAADASQQVPMSSPPDGAAPNVQTPEPSSYHHTHPLLYATGHHTAGTVAGGGGASASTANSCFKYDDM